MRKLKLLGLGILFVVFLLLFLSGIDLDLKNLTPLAEATNKPTATIWLPTNTPTVTSTPLPTNVPTATPTLTPTPFFNAVNPLRIEGQNNSTIIDFENTEEIIVTFNGEQLQGGVVIYNLEDDDFEQQLGGCSGANLVVSNARSGDEYVTYKTLIYAHSGTCRNGRIMPFESFRSYLEGPIYNPNMEQRETMLQSIIGEIVCLNEACFTVVDAVYVTRDQIEELGYVDGKIDWYFDSGVIQNVQEIFLGFCGSEGGLPSQWFSAKYYIRLQRIN